MASNKERIEQLEAGIGLIHDNVSRIEMGMADKFQQLETTLHRLMEAVSISREEVVGSTGGRRRDGHHSGRAESSTPMFQSKFAKLEFPRFAARDPTMWLTKVRQFFDYQETPGTQKVQYAAYHLEDEANEWWQATKRAYAEEETEITWEVFEEELWARFGPTECEDFDEALSKIKQAGTFRDYQREFERLVNKVQGWTQKALVGTFMGGLHPAIVDGIRMFRPKSLKEAISLARMKDEQLQRQRRTQPNTPQIQRNTQHNSKGPLTTKRLNWEEIRKKRSLGLCFSCDERYTPGHKCRQPQLLLMEGESGWESSEMEEPLVEQEPEISLYALAGWSESRTMRIYAQIGPHQLVALIDSGSTHNFISEKMATMLQLPVVPTRPFPVCVANGTPMQCRWKYETVCVSLGGVSFSLTLFALPLTSLDLVLGVQWLELLGPVVCDWRNLTMEFEWRSQNCVLQGLRTTPIQPVEFQCLSKEARQGHALFAIYATEEGNSTPVPQELKELIEAFEDIFQAPSQLPPQRDIEHQITMKEGTEPINVRPYRYAYFQKDEIERQVSDMLNSGLIRPSSSPFSSPVLLVKKKDGSWWFCTDYRALNAATIKDRFPIPTVEDMLDELHGAAYFTKLDLTASYHQVRLHPPDIYKTAFRTHNGHYEYLVMPFGLCNAPSTFQALMNSVFRPFLRKFVLVFFDDILVYSSSWQEHLQHVKTIFELLRQHQLFVKFNKCEFGKHKLEYLGHIISADGVKVDQSKIQAMLDWPRPTTVTELRAFLGLTGYYRKFVHNYGIIACALTNLLKKGKFQWDEAVKKAFENLKAAMTTTPTLALPDFSSPFVIQTDASGDGIGAVLSQNGRPIAFMSRALDWSATTIALWCHQARL